MTRAYYSEFDPTAAAWLRELIAAGEITEGTVDERDIRDVAADDLRRHQRVHLFAGIAGWELALRLAGWPADLPVWTGSCPCQPFSSAGKRLGQADDRDLWPEMLRLIRECRPPVVFGEQVASSEVVGTELEAAFVVAVQGGDYARANKLAKRLVRQNSFHFHPRWVTRIRADLEAEGYTVRLPVLGAHSAGAPHIRQRLFWVADREEFGREQGRRAVEERAGLGDDRGVGGVADAHSCECGRCQGRDVGACEGAAEREVRVLDAGRRGGHGGVGDPVGERVRGGGRGADGAAAAGVQGPHGQRQRVRPDAGAAGASVGVARGDANEPRPQGRGLSHGGRADERPLGPAGGADFWSDATFIPCRDGRYRRVPRGVEPGVLALASRLSACVAGGGLEGRDYHPLAAGKVEGRVGVLRGAGNAIVPATAALFIRAWMRARGLT